MNREIELALVRSLKRGDPLAFDTIYEAHRADVFAFLVRLGRDPYLAEELLEETWLRLVSRAATLANDSRILPWLLTVARNLFMSHRRTRRMDVDRLQALSHSPDPPGNGSSPFEATAANELERALAALPV